MKDYLNDGKEHLEKRNEADALEQLEKEVLENLWDAFDLLDEDSFEVTKEETLADGLTFKILERSAQMEKIAEQETFTPADYTSTAVRDADGMLHPGQVELDKLTDKAMENISGDIVEDIPQWSLQLEQNSCAVNAQRFVINSLKDANYTEEELIQTAREMNIYHDYGTVSADVGKLAEAYGLECEQIENSSLEELERIHDAGGKTIVTINCLKLAYPNMFGFFQADHAVQVVGIDRNDPEDVRVILNDPGREDGAGLSVPADVFMKTWDTGNRFVTAVYPEVKK